MPLHRIDVTPNGNYTEFVHLILYDLQLSSNVIKSTFNLEKYRPEWYLRKSIVPSMIFGFLINPMGFLRIPRVHSGILGFIINNMGLLRKSRVPSCYFLKKPIGLMRKPKIIEGTMDFLKYHAGLYFSKLKVHLITLDDNCKSYNIKCTNSV